MGELEPTVLLVSTRNPNLLTILVGCRSLPVTWRNVLRSERTNLLTVERPRHS